MTFQYQYNDLQRKWLDDLKTTTEPQTKHVLHRTLPGNDEKVGFCCLGRACVVADWPVFDQTGIVTYGVKGDMDDINLPRDLADKLKLRSVGGSLVEPIFPDDGRPPWEKGAGLVDLNDNLNWTFKQIAEYIEANPDNVFADYEEQKKAYEESLQRL